jgi:hypothetical protein
MSSFFFVMKHPFFELACKELAETPKATSGHGAPPFLAYVSP